MPLKLRVTAMIDAVFASSLRLFAVFFLLVFALKWPFIAVPPVWDEAFSVFPAAAFLVENGFNISLLLQQPSYLQGGPNSHGLSLQTLLTALVLKFTGGGTPTWVVLHMIQWIMAAGIGAMLARLYGTALEKAPSLLLAIATLSYPLVLAQMGFMYLEVPVLFFTVMAFTLVYYNRVWLAALFLAAACLTKGSALIGVGTLAMTVFICRAVPLKRRMVEVLILSVPLIFLIFMTVTLADFGVEISPHETTSIILLILQKNLSIYQNYIAIIPEFNIIYPLAFFSSIIFFYRIISQWLSQATIDGSDTIVFYNASFVLVYTFFYFILYPYHQKYDPHFLTRYFFYVIPSLFFVIYLVIDRLLPRQDLKILILALLVLLFLVNRSGVLYPPLQFPSIAMAERSEEYLDGYVVSREYTALLEREVPEDVPIFVSLPDYFLTQYPVNGYVTKPLPNVRYIVHVLNEQGPDFRYPDRFVLVYSYPWLGGQYILHMLRLASESGEYSVELMGQFIRGKFTGHVFHFSRVAVTSSH